MKKCISTIRHSLLWLFCAITVAALPHTTSAQQAADFVYHNGNIYTVLLDQPWAQAVAITGEYFVFVGSNEKVKSYIGPDTKVVDLESKFVTPGFYDMHVHPDLLYEPKYVKQQIQTPPAGPEELREAILKHAQEL